MGRKVSGQQQTTKKWPSVCQVQTGRTVSTQAFTQAAHLSPPSTHSQRYRGVSTSPLARELGPGQKQNGIPGIGNSKGKRSPQFR